MSAKHTPGPWIYYERHGTIGSIFNAEGDQVAQASQITPAKDASSHDLRRANARLIAASPDLLAAAKKVASHSPASGGFASAMYGLVMAIEKAEGRA